MANLLKLVYLESCPYSIALKEYLDIKKLKYKMIEVKYKNKNECKESYNIDTFPNYIL